MSRTTLVPCLIIVAVICATAAENRGKARPWLVKSVHFTGNTYISSADLLSGMDTRPSGLFHAVKFSPSLLNADLEEIASLYRDKGFLDISVKAGDISREQASRRVTVSIVINEGAQTCIDSAAIRGATPFDEAALKRFIASKAHAPYSAAGLLYDQQTLRDSLAARGYALGAVDRIDSVDSVAHRATVTFVIDQGPPVLSGPLVVNGAKKLHPVIIKRGVTFAPGDTVTTAKIQRSMRQLYETGMFKYVQISIPVADSAQARRSSGSLSLPVLVNIEESDFYRLQGGVGYGTYEGVRLSLQTSYGNVLGLGRTIALDGKYSRLIQGLHLTYAVPWLFLLPPSAAVELFGEHHNEVTFTGYLEGSTWSLFAKTPWNLGYRVFTTFEWVQGVAIQPQESTFTSMIPGNNTQSFGVGFTYDIRDNILDASKGLFLTTDAEVAGLIGAGTNHFYKVMADLRGYYPLAHFLDAACAATAAYINGYGVDKNVVPPQELLYAGSQTIRPVRGYAPGGVGDAVGGRLALVLTIMELRFAIAKWLKIAGFADAGYVWTAAPLFSARDLRFTAGPGIRIRTPVGFLSADMGVRLNGPTKGNTGFSVSIGEPF
ncbi:MAG: BamA/TamA family outer membrane protein [Chitinivibrionales bacterium]|nr:BamA/TamA family outer membrane protein [Chitinivibrionales bacterium]